MYFNGIPNPDRVGFIQLDAIGHGDDFSQEIELLCQIIQKQSYFIDAAGYENEITAASVDRDRGRYAWVAYKSKELERGFVDVHFHLNVIVDNRIIVEWEIETYNPYFGCQVNLLHWADECLILIYREKHDTYVCTFAVEPSIETQSKIKEPIARHEINEEWLIWEGMVVSSGDKVDRVQRMALPDLCLLESWSADYARSIGALPPDYDERNEMNKRRQR